MQILGCYGADGADCEKASLQAGFHSGWQYTMTSLFYEVYIAPSGTILIIPVVLLACDWVSQVVSEPPVRWCLGSCLCACILFLSDAHIDLERGMLMVAAMKQSPVWLMGIMVSLIFDLWLVWFFFFRKRHQNHPRMLVRG